jgi:pectinesterase
MGVIMKTHLRILTLIAGLLALVNSTGFGQVSSNATWTCATDASVQTSGQILGTAEAITSNLVYGSYASPGTNYYTQRIKMNAWPSMQLTQLDTVYIQFRVAPQTSYTLRVDSIVLSLGAVSSQDMRANLYYSKDSTFATKTRISYTTSGVAKDGLPAGVLLSSSKLDTIRAATNVAVNQGEKFYFRIYPWVDSSSSVTGKYVAPQNVKIYGTAIPIPITASAIWPLMSSSGGNAAVSGLITAGSITFDGTNLYHYGYGSNGDRWTNHLPSNGAWPPESTPNFSRYAQFSVAPQTGGTFYATSITFSQIVEFTTNLRVAFYYSNDSSFSTQTFIADTTVPMTESTYTYSINDTVATGQRMYLRFYPYDVTGDPSWKLEDVDTVIISGATTGLAILAPTVSTTIPSYVSTTFLTGGGNVTADGGGTVAARGVCWNTTGTPTISDSHTSDGSGIGSFTSSVTGLAAGGTYYIRAYATNVGGTGYGSQDTVSTLAAVVAPTVTTKTVTSILVSTAVSGGNVTSWGGAAVTARGVCWNTTGSPTTSDSKTSDGTDIGSFTSGLTGLTGGVTYHVRAYAANSAGTGYGGDTTFVTQVAQPDTTVVVASDGSGNYTTVQAAFNAVPVNYTGKWTIYVKKGSYHEKDTLASTKSNVILLGEDRDSTTIWNDDYGDKYGSGNPGTSGTFTVTIEASDFAAKNITLQNTYWPNRYGVVSGTQAVALRVNGDRQEYINCKLLGYQDTYYTWGGAGAGRVYMKDCFIEGSVDFIFGRDIVVFDSCTIHEIKNGGTLTAASTDASSQYGYAFRNCTILADSIGYDTVAVTSFYLGRPWQSSPRTVFIHCYEPAILNAAGWLAWNVTPALYAEYNPFGPGSSTSGRVSWSSQLSSGTASNYSLSNIFAKSSASSSLILYDWMPPDAKSADNLPAFDTPLPVEMISFTANYSSTGVTLNWTMSSELNNSGWDVERASMKNGAESEWQKIGHVDGRPNSTELTKYSFLDRKALTGTFDYRLKQMDVNGNYTYSKSIQVAINIPTKISLSNYPNPFNPTTELRYAVPEPGRVTLRVYNTIGQLITTLVDQSRDPGVYEVPFDGSAYSSGMYFARLELNGRGLLSKMLLIK